MAWTNFPVVAEDSSQTYDLYSELSAALTERARIVASLPDVYWVQKSTAWGWGVVTQITDNMDGTFSIRDEGADWVNAPGCTGKRWVSYVCGECQDFPSNYDLIIEVGGKDDERKVIRAHIIDVVTSSGPELDTLVVTDIQHYVTSGLIDDVGDTVGKNFAIIGADGLWWNEKLAPFPNTHEVVKGTATGSTTISITDTTKQWTVDQWVGYEVMSNDGSSGEGSQESLRRYPITANTEDTLVFLAQGITPDGEYVIIEAGGVWRRTEHAAIREWYKGWPKKYWSRFPGDQPGWPGHLQETSFAAEEFTMMVPGEIDCEEDQINALDIDIWTSLDQCPQNCEDPEKNYTPRINWTMRSMQASAQGLMSGFVEQKDYTDLGFIPKFVLAAWFYVAGINSGESVVEENGTIYFDVDPIYNGKEIHYTLIDHVDNFWRAGTNVAVDGKVEVLGGVSEDVGLVVWYSAGWTRYKLREVVRMYPTTVFIPTVILTPEPIAVDPPQDDPDPEEPLHDATGIWETRGADTKYLDYTKLGHPSFIDDFVPGEHARYVGNSWNNPTIMDPLVTGSPRYPDVDYQFRHSAYWQGPSQSGAASSGSFTQLRDDSKDWWDGVLIEHTQSATPLIITTTTLQDTGKSADNFWLHPDRGRWVDHIIEILQPGDDPPGTRGALHGTRRPITAYNHTTQTITFDAITDLSDEYDYEDIEGDPQVGTTQYRIREPGGDIGSWTGEQYQLNRWRGRLLQVFHDEEWVSIEIKYSDDMVLYFDEQEVEITEGMLYRIVEHQPGGVWTFATTAPVDDRPFIKIATDKYWIKPVGEDARGEPWLTNQRGNSATQVKDYGMLRKGDIVTMNVYNELYAGINALRATLHSYSWSNQELQNTAQGDSCEASEPGPETVPCKDHQYPNPPNDYNTATAAAGASKAAATADFALDLSGANVAPHKWSSVELAELWLDSNADDIFETLGFGGAGAALKAAFAFGVFTVPNPGFGCEVDFYVKGAITALDEDEGYSEPESGTALQFVFDSNGDDNAGAVLYRKWSHFHTDEPVASGQEIVSAQFGDVDSPNEADTVLTPASTGPLRGATSTRGYHVVGQQAICNWDRGGLVHVD